MTANNNDKIAAELMRIDQEIYRLEQKKKLAAKQRELAKVRKEVGEEHVAKKIFRTIFSSKK